MSNFTVEDINNKINSFNEKVFYIEIKISNNSIHLTTLKKNRNVGSKQLNVFNNIKKFFNWWVKQHFENANNYLMNSDTEVSTFFTFKTKKILWEITNLTKKAIEEYKEDRGIPSENFQLVSEDSIGDRTYDADVLRYKIKIPKTAMSTNYSFNSLKELRF